MHDDLPGADDTMPDFCEFSPERQDEEQNDDARPLHLNGGTPFTNAFPNTVPHPRERLNGETRIPQKLKTYWESKVPEELKQFMVSTEDVFKPLCMTPTPELLKTMCAKSKCMEVVRPGDESLLYLPTYGSTMCFIAMGGSGELPEPMQEVLYFFGQVANSIGNYSPFVVPTETVDIVVRHVLSYCGASCVVKSWLQVDRSDPKIITGLTSTGEGLEPRAPKRRRNNDRGGFVTMTDILAKRALDGSGEVKKVVHGLTIFVGNTGVVFKNTDGTEQREIFTVVMVSSRVSGIMVGSEGVCRPTGDCG